MELLSLDGSDAAENESSRYIPYKNDVWYTFRVQVTDQRIVCHVDDSPLINVHYEGRHVGTRLETNPSKPLGFSTWETGGELRKIEIRALTPDEIATINTPED